MRGHEWIIRGVLFLATAGSLTAQQVVRGRVVDSLKNPMSGVSVSSGALQTTSRDDGRFELAGFPFGASRLVLRHVGYAPVSIDINFYSPDTLEKTFTMLRLTALDTMTVRADSAPPLGLSTFERRRRDIQRTGFGKVLDEAYLAKSGTQQLGTVLSMQTGFRTQTVRGQSWVLSRRMSLMADSKSAQSIPCYAQVFLDGVRLFRGGRYDPSLPPPPDINAFAISGLFAIEL